MQPYNYRFENVLTYRELEKTETEIEYKKSVEAFELSATELYELLKKKEETIEEQAERMKTGFIIEDMHHYSRFIASLEKTIMEVQQTVMQSRSKMNWYEDKLLERTLEVRKFEKMKEKDRENYQVEMDYKEARRLDELSTMTFRGREIGW